MLAQQDLEDGIAIAIAYDLQACRKTPRSVDFRDFLMRLIGQKMQLMRENEAPESQFRRIGV
jgi:hypothetical protein